MENVEWFSDQIFFFCLSNSIHRCRYDPGANTGAINASRASHVEVTDLTNGKAANIVFADVEKATLRDVTNRGRVRISGGGRYTWEAGDRLFPHTRVRSTPCKP